MWLGSRVSERVLRQAEKEGVWEGLRELRRQVPPKELLTGSVERPEGEVLNNRVTKTKQVLGIGLRTRRYTIAPITDPGTELIVVMRPPSRNPFTH